MAPSKVADYATLPLSLPPQSSLQLSTPTTHTLYLRSHAPKIPTESDSRSLFIVNIPVDATSTHIRALFSTLIGAGRFESVTFEGEKNPSSNAPTVANNRNTLKHKKRKRGSDAHDDTTTEDLPATWDRPLHRSGSTAVVVLIDEKSVESTLKAIRKVHKSGKAGSWPIWGESIESKIPRLGSARYAAHHALRYPDKATIQAHVDLFMSSFNARESETAANAKKARNVPDEDGFVTVTRGGRTGPARIQDAEDKRAEMEKRDKEKREGMSDFYRFQMRERRKAEQGELVRRFEEDRVRVEGMREKRGRFRPEK